ncbi:uro-adherence factor A isoform X2 [Periplaneta americana]|uniref:uro-adherence factor A isoform X2 n=1 Tax=Periplaneta americana TaxID=6978 RepID=UPI0037E736E2
MACTEGSDQESLPKSIIRHDNNHQLQDRLESDTDMKQGIGKGGGGGGGDNDEEKGIENGEGQEDNTSKAQEVHPEQRGDLDETMTNENLSDLIVDQMRDKSYVSEDLKDELSGLEVTDQSLESGGKDSVVDSELSEMGSVHIQNSSFKLDSVDFSSLVSLEEEFIVSDKETNMYLVDTTDTETAGDDGTEADQDATVENSDFRSAEPNGKVTGDGSDSGVEVNGFSSYGGRESSPALLRAFSSNSGGYTSSCGGLEDSLTASTATPAASCDSSLISCYSTYEDTEDIVTNTTTMMLQVDGDGTSEGGSESSSVTSKDTRTVNCKNGSGKKMTPSANRNGAKKRTLAADVAKNSVSSASCKSKSASPTATPVNTSRTKLSSQRQSPVASKTPSSQTGTGAVSKSSAHTSSQKRDKLPATMTTSGGAIKSRPSTSGSSTKSSASSSMSKSACGSLPSGSKVRSKDSSMTSGSESRRDGVPSSATTPKGRGAKSVRSKVIGGTDDGRWPSSANKPHAVLPRSRGGSVVDGQGRKLNVASSSSTVSSGSFMESKATALEKYATLPRRRRCKSPEIQVGLETTLRSHSVSRDPSLNRAASLRKQHYLREGGSLNKSLPPYPRRRFHGRTVIYHETSSQTALTASDVEKALAGVAVKEPGNLDAVETQEQEIQVDRRMEEVERLEFQLKLLTEDHTRLKADSVRQIEELTTKERLLEEEKAEKLAVKEELDQHSDRVLAMLRNAKGDHLDENDDADCLQALETYLQSSSHVVIKQQQEINELQTLCRTLKRDLEKSLAAQKTLLQQQQEIEAESIELQEFLQAEKSTLAEALRDAEAEIKGQREQLSQKESELERQQEECKHLVRISEQRRQENLALQARLCSLEQRSRELLLQQGAAVSGAAVALSGLSSRLDGLVEQLVMSYNISEKDLEDVIFHNEAYSKSNSSIEASPEKISANRASEQPSFDPQRTPSPKRGASFVTAVISAIKNAATGGTGKRVLHTEDTAQELFQETSEETSELGEPTAEDLDAYDTASNPRYSTGSITTTCLANSESLQNLSQAILNRQQFELAQTDGGCSDDLTSIDYESSGVDLLPPLEDCSPAITLVDQIIEVDNLVTKLLKVLRIIQLENDTCMDELHDERIQLAEQVRREQESRREVQDEVRNWERLGARLRGEVQDVRLQLQRRVQDLEHTRDELQRHKDQVEQLTKELHNLSSVCKQTELQLRSHEEEAENVLQQWQESGKLPSPEVLARVVTARGEIPGLKEKLAEKEQQLNEIGQKYSLNKQILTENWHQAATEVRRQYEAIDSALETLHSIQGVVMQCPSLAKLQQDLEETNFQCASSLPLIAADLNANAPQIVTLNGTHNGGSNNGLETTHKSGNAINGKA